MNKNLLLKFCHTDNEILKSPFSIGDFTYATNGMILIRVPQLPEYPENPKAPNPELLDYEKPEKWYPVGDVEMPEAVDCEECDDSGFVQWANVCSQNEYEAECKSCDGTGEILPQIPMDFNGVTFDQRYLALLSELPNCEIGLVFLGRSLNKTATTPFRFDGGSGIIMPMYY